MVKYQPWFFTEIAYLGPTSRWDSTGMFNMPSHERWEDIYKISSILNYCDYLARIEASIPSNEHDLLTTHQATILHLLCVGIDAWASGSWLDFGDWIATNQDDKNYGRSERDKQLRELTATVHNAHEEKAQEVLRSGIAKLHDIYKQFFGKWRKFESFFMTLPEPVKQILIEHYVVGKDTDARDVEKSWSEREASENLRLLARYLWDCRRNEYTHEGRVSLGAISDYFKLIELQKGKKTTSWIIASNLPEHMLIRCALLASIRQAVYADVSRLHLRMHIRVQIRRYCNTEDRHRYISVIGDDI